MASSKNIRTAAVFLVWVIALFAPAMHALFAQRPSPAEGPWSGQAQCVVVGKWTDYLDEQTHTWRLTGEAPTPPAWGSAQVYYTWPAVWSVQGSGRKTFPAREPVAIGREQSERWTIASDMNISLRTTDLGTGRVRIGAEGQRGAPLGAMRVTEVSGRTRDASVQPWSFPAIEDSAATTTISGTSVKTYPEGFGVGWAQPPKAVTTATCTWSFLQPSEEQSRSTTKPEMAPANGAGRARSSGTVPVAPAIPAATSPSTVTLPRPGTQIGAAPLAPLMPPPRTIALTGFTAAGNAVFVPPRSIALSGFTAVGNAVFVPPRTIGLSGWSSVGTPASSPGGPNE